MVRTSQLDPLLVFLLPLFLGLTVVFDPGIQAVYRHAQPCRHLGNRQATLGFVRKILPQTVQRAGQRDHRGKTPGQLVVAGADSSALFQPAKHALDDVPLSVLRAVKQPG
ncbi:hypothetical protein D9M69_353450 [compost metagenome]